MTSAKVQHAWSPLDRWTLIRRKRNASGSTLNETLFCLRDYLDPVALANTSGAVVERYSYDAFGTVRIMNAAFGVLGNSAYEWEFLYHGEFRDKESELYNYGYRYLDTQLGRWLSRDSIGEWGGRNLYAFVGNNGASHFDSLGTIPAKCEQVVHDALEAARKAVIDYSIKNKNDPRASLTEFCGLICCKKETEECYYKEPKKGTGIVDTPKGPASFCNPFNSPCNEGDSIVAWYHTHPGSSLLSDEDFKLTKDHNIPGSMIDGTGTKKRFEPPAKEGDDRGGQAYWDPTLGKWIWFSWDQKTKKYIPKK